LAFRVDEGRLLEWRQHCPCAKTASHRAEPTRRAQDTEVVARSLADRRIISHFKFVLINRTHMIAASEIGRAGDISHEDVPDL